MLAGIGVGLTTSPPVTLSDVWVMERARAAIKARAYAVLNLVLLVASAIGSLAAGVLTQNISAQAAALIGAGLCAGLRARRPARERRARVASPLPERSG